MACLTPNNSIKALKKEKVLQIATAYINTNLLKATFLTQKRTGISVTNPQTILKP